MTTRRPGRADLSGRLGEEFCHEQWGIEEDDQYEIKSTCNRNNQVVLKTAQLVNSVHKMYVVVRYTRKHRTLKKGKHKGRWMPTETIEEAYKKHLDVFCASAIYLWKKIEELSRPLRSTSYANDAAWAPYWTVQIKSFPQDVLFEDKRVTVYGDPLDPPAFLREPEDEPPPF